MHGCTCYYSVHYQANIFDCRNKNLTSLPKDALLHTDQLLASGNNFNNIVRVEKYIENLSHIDLSNSNVSSITGSVMRSMLKKLKTLNLVNNNLDILPRSIMETNNDTRMWLSNNSYECNCDMMWMRDWLVKATNVMDKEGIVCTKGKMIGDCVQLKLIN